MRISFITFLIFLSADILPQSSLSCAKRKEIFKYDSTHIKSEAWYCNNVIDSVYKEWYRTGVLKETGYYASGFKNGIWESWGFGSSDYSFGYHTFSEYKNGRLLEERIYEFKDSVANLFKIYTYRYNEAKRDTIKIQRQFHPQTGIMTLMDTLVNNSFNGIAKHWSDIDGKLLDETYTINGKMVWRRYYDRQNNTTIKNYYPDSWGVMESEFVYNGLDKLVEERHYDIKGKLISEKKY